MKATLSSNNAPKALGPYSHGYKFGNMVVTSGQLGINPISNELAVGVEEQTKQSLENVKAVLLAGGAKLSDVVKTTVFIKDMNDFSKVNAIYAEYFTSNFPARTCVEVARLPKDALVEIEALAYVE